PSHGPGERIEGTAHVDRLDGDEHANRGRQAQHERSARTRRTRVSSWNASVTSISAPATRTTYRASARAGPARTSSTNRGVELLRIGLAAPRERLIRHALSDRPSIPCCRAHAPALSPAAFAAFRHARASCSSWILRRIARDGDREHRPGHPGVAERSPRARRGPASVPDLFGFGGRPSRVVLLPPDARARRGPASVPDLFGFGGRPDPRAR